mmetsp:Transcript_14352/g.21506  ORF Transcript_14352/g.21506 Transcript_14352/m.21506 type:complete len:243 (-) Transcript_14352:167-895(-)
MSSWCNTSDKYAARVIFLLYFILLLPFSVISSLVVLRPLGYDAEREGKYIGQQYYDFLEESDKWMEIYAWIKLIIHAPFCLVAIYGFVFKKNWIIKPCIVFGTHEATEMMHILTTIISQIGADHSINISLVLVYTPFIILPLFLVIFMVAVNDPFQLPGSSSYNSSDHSYHMAMTDSSHSRKLSSDMSESRSTAVVYNSSPAVVTTHNPPLGDIESQSSENDCASVPSRHRSSRRERYRHRN